MTIALSSLMTGFLEFIEAVAVESTADAGSDDTKIVDSALSIYGNGYFNDWWIYVTSGSAKGDIRQVETYTKSSTTLDPYVDFSAAVSADDTYELHKHNPDTVKRAINDALLSIYPKLYKTIVFHSLGKDDLAQNATSGQKDVVVSDASLFFVGQECEIKDDNNSEDCTIASINTTTDTLTMEDNLTNSYATAASAWIHGKSGKYWNLGETIGYARVNNVFIKDTDTTRRSRQVEWQVIQSLAGDRQLYFPKSISVDEDVWVIEAMGKLEEVSDPADTITLEDRRVRLLYCEAAYHFYERQANEISSGDWDRLKALAASYGPWNAHYPTKANRDYRHLWMAAPVEFADIETDSDIGQSRISQSRVTWNP